METTDYFCGTPPEEQTPEGFVKALSEAQRHAQRMRTELNKALGSLDALDQIVEMASEPTLWEEDYHHYAKAASDSLWNAIEANYRANSQGHKANEHIFDVLRVFMARRWREVRENRDKKITQLTTSAPCWRFPARETLTR